MEIPQRASNWSDQVQKTVPQTLASWSPLRASSTEISRKKVKVPSALSKARPYCQNTYHQYQRLQLSSVAVLKYRCDELEPVTGIEEVKICSCNIFVYSGHSFPFSSIPQHFVANIFVLWPVSSFINCLEPGAVIFAVCVSDRCLKNCLWN